MERSSLMSSSNVRPTYDPWTNGDPGSGGSRDDDEDSALLDVGQIRQQQRRMIDEQDQGLEALSRIIGRQKQIALDIGEEVVTQNEILDDINDRADQTNTRLIRETKHVTFVDKKSSTCWMWVVIILLLVAIVVIMVVPIK